MLLPKGLHDEVDQRLVRVRDLMRERGYGALLVYGNNKVQGSLRYLSGYFPDRGGWLAVFGPERSDIHIFDGATLFLPLEGEPVVVSIRGSYSIARLARSGPPRAAWGAPADASLRPRRSPNCCATRRRPNASASRRGTSLAPRCPPGAPAAPSAGRARSVFCRRRGLDG